MVVLRTLHSSRRKYGHHSGFVTSLPREAYSIQYDHPQIDIEVDIFLARSFVQSRQELIDSDLKLVESKLVGILC